VIPSAVKELAVAAGIPVLQPATLRSAELQQQLRAVQADAMIVAAYGQILPRAVLDIPRFGAINIHASLLPRWRGAAPIERCLLAGDNYTGVTIVQMDEGLDTGPVLMQQRLAVEADDTARTLREKLARLGAALIVETLAQLPKGTLHAEPQSTEGVTYAPKIDKSEAHLDWEKPARVLERQVRAFNPYPVARGLLGGSQVRIWAAHQVPDARGDPGRILDTRGEGMLVACGEGALMITELQRAGGRRIAARSFVQGFQVGPDERFT
jgi:methionyl-tRNA formyltransferase